MKRFFLLFITFSLVSSNVLIAQGYAGPDKHICPGKSAQIGSDPIPGACYTWSPAETLNNPQAANPIATPAQTTTYTVTVVGPNFSFTATDQVTVFLENGISEISAIPLLCCWKSGQEIEPGQFHITTIPQGLEGELYDITCNPDVASWILPGSTTTLTVTITARSHCGDPNQVFTTTCDITAVREEFEIAVTEGFSGIDIQGLMLAANFIIDKMEKVPGPCSPTVGPQALTISGTTTDYTLCCPKPTCVKPGTKYTGSLTYGPNISCNFPFLGIPWVASVNVYLSVGVSASVNFDGIVTTCEGNKKCISLTIAANAAGGVSATAVGGYVLKGILALVFIIDAPVVEYCYPVNTWTFLGKPCVRIDIMGSITVFTFLSKTVNVTLLPKSCF